MSEEFASELARLVEDSKSRPIVKVELGLDGDDLYKINIALRSLWQLRLQMAFDVEVELSENVVQVHDIFGNTVDWQRVASNLETKFGAEESEKLIINVSYRCNNKCGFCSVADRKRSDGAFERQIEAMQSARARGVKLLDLDGGEPLMYSRIFDLIESGHELGFERITLTSNGRMLADEDFCKKLSQSGVDLLISIHSSSPELHDNLTSTPGSWRQTVKGIMNARKMFKRLGLNVTVLRNNIEDLPRLAQLVAKLGADVFNIQIYTPFGDADPDFAPTPDALRRFVPPAIDYLKDKMQVFMINAPHCLVPGYEDYCTLDYHKSVRRMLFANGEEVNLAEYLGRKRFKNGLCKGCPNDVVCGGFWDYGKHPDSGEVYKVFMLDMIAGYACDADCPFCAVDDELWTHNMTTEEIRRKITDSMAFDPKLLRFGGGEPTIREDFFELVEFGAALGFETLSVQTHGFKLADMGFVEKLERAGCNKVNFSVRGDNAETHEKLTRVPGSFDLLVEGIKNVVAQGRMLVEIDMIVSAHNFERLPQELEFFYNLGARRFNMWFISLEGRVKSRVDELVPQMSKAAPYIKRACDKSRELGVDSMKVYYLPYCFMKGFEEFVWHPLDENALVLSPGSDFKLDRGQIDIGVKRPPCSLCSMYERCFGIAPAYTAHFGDEELEPYEK